MLQKYNVYEWKKNDTFISFILCIDPKEKLETRNLNGVWNGIWCKCILHKRKEKKTQTLVVDVYCIVPPFILVFLFYFSSSQFLMSPVYPKYYVGGRRCKWTLRSDPGQRIQLRFLDISLREEVSQSNHPQCADSIRVTERGRNLLSMCGESKQDIILLSDANKLEASLIWVISEMFTSPIRPRISALAHLCARKCARTLTVWSQSSHPQCANSIRVTERGRNLLSMCGESKQDIVLLSDADKLEASLIPGVPSLELRFGWPWINVYYSTTPRSLEASLIPLQ